MSDPRGQEDPTPGNRMRITRDQIREIADHVAGTDGALEVEIEEQGQSHFEVSLYDASGAAIGEPLVVLPTADA